VFRFVHLAGAYTLVMLLALGIELFFCWGAWHLFRYSLQAAPEDAARAAGLGIIISVAAIIFLPAAYLVGLRVTAIGLFEEFRVLIYPEGDGDDCDPSEDRIPLQRRSLGGTR